MYGAEKKNNHLFLKQGCVWVCVCNHVFSWNRGVCACMRVHLFPHQHSLVMVLLFLTCY